MGNEQSGDLDVEVGIIPSLNEKPVRKKEKMLGELTDDDPVLNRLKSFEVELYNGIMDYTLNEFDKRFSKHEYLYKSLELLIQLILKELSMNN